MSNGEGSRQPRRARNGSATRDALLNAAVRVIVDEGYAAVSTRRIAEVAGVKAPLVHYHFGTLQDLLLEVYRREAEQSLQRHVRAMARKDPLQALWEMNADAERTGLALEFMAMARHRKRIADVIARYAEQIRAIQIVALERHFRDTGRAPGLFPPTAISVILDQWRVRW